jgi:hypothetical protein
VRRISTTSVLRFAEPADSASVRTIVREETAREGKTAEVLATSVKELVREQLLGVKTELNATEKILTAQVGSVKNELMTALNEKVAGMEKQLEALSWTVRTLMGGMAVLVLVQPLAGSILQRLGMAAAQGDSPSA